ncbi:THUMP domain-containing protein 3 [Triplophysa dalaica]|uniref:THUMP domain-containing protein 3 n=1 Tax=Triplophysa dalaica TaxID=1582913 RepID=UPI0024DF6785|nr:THUMP domain-containing protein 3 [Triplophysa dalaica]
MMQELNETVTIGATVPTGFELTSAEEIQEKLEATARINKDRGKIYFDITSDKLSKLHNLRSVDHLFVVVKKYDNYQFKGTKEEEQVDLQELAAKLSWTSALEVWKMNNSLKKKKGRRKGTYSKKSDHSGNVSTKCTTETVPSDPTSLSEDLEALQVPNQTDVSHPESGPQTEKLSGDQEALPLKFRVTCNRAGDNHCFSSNDAARDFGGAVQDLFLWKPDMTKFDIEVLLNIHNVEVVIGIALTEVSLHRRNITHFGPTTLRPTLAYGMLRLCKPQPSDVILDPMCGSGVIPLEGAIEWQNSFFLAGDNNGIAINRTVNNVKHLLKNRPVERSSSGLPIDIIQWDLCNLSVRSSSVDIIITDMPFGKRMGSRKKNWELYPLCLREMARVCRPDTGRAVLLTQDKKCFTKAILQMGELWRRSYTAWVNVGGLRAGVFVLQRTGLVFGTASGDVKKPREETESQREDMEDKSL